MLESMWIKGEYSSTAGKNCTSTLEISMTDYQKIGNQPTSELSNTTLGYIHKGCSIILQGHLFSYVHSSIIYSSQNLETTWVPLK